MKARRAPPITSGRGTWVLLVTNNALIDQFLVTFVAHCEPRWLRTNEARGILNYWQTETFLVHFIVRSAGIISIVGDWSPWTFRITNHCLIGCPRVTFVISGPWIPLIASSRPDFGSVEWKTSQVFGKHPGGTIHAQACSFDYSARQKLTQTGRPQQSIGMRRWYRGEGDYFLIALGMAKDRRNIVRFH